MLKENIVNTKINALNELKKLQIKEYNYISDKDKNKCVGLIIEEVKNDYINEHNEGINSYHLLIHSVKAIQELKTENDLLKENMKKMYENMKRLNDKINLIDL